MNGVALCAGIGGLELGLRIALGDYRTVCYVEREVYCASVIVARMAEQALCEAPVWDDISTFDGRPWRGVVDIITSGDPCQPFSVAGQRQGKSDERYLWPHVERIIREVEPKFVFLENVAGAVDVRYEHKAVLEGMGYRVEAGLFSAEEVGAPHQRVRVFLLAQDAPRIGWGRRDDGGSGGCRRTSEVEGLCGELGNPTRQGLQVLERDGQASSPTAWPPGPSDLDSWRRILAEWPELEPAVAYPAITGATDKLRAPDRQGRPPEVPQGDGEVSAILDNATSRGDTGEEVEPAICGVVDGPAFRVERLSCLGNAVVPVVAALAFTTLWGRLNNGQAIEVAPYKSGP
jgi:DNA (cytosine-5)-methyltransferase 1